jgi:hypothetical protein
MTAQNTNFMAFDGEAVTARLPAEIRISDGLPLSPQQAGGVAHVYHLFCQARAMAPGSSYFVQHRRLADGTGVHMESINGTDVVRVSPVRGKPLRPIELAGYLLLPRDADNTGGWNKDDKPDSARAYIGSEKPPLTDEPKIELHVKLQAGAIDWRGEDGEILTYDHNGNNRYHTSMWNKVFRAATSASDSAAQGIYYKGTKISTPAGVSAAAVWGSKIVFLSNDTLYLATSPLDKIDRSLAQGVFLEEVSPEWVTVTVTGTVSGARRCSAWHFSPDGSRAACAVVYTSGVLDAWTMDRARTEELAQATRYIDISLDIDGTTVLAEKSDSAFTGAPFSATIGGAVLDDGYTSGGGALVFAGKRLWGVDFDADGNELEITCERGGSGQLSLVGSPTITSITLATTRHWGAYVNGDELVRADYLLPEHTVASSVYTHDGPEGLSCEYIAIHAMDARHMAAVVERLTLSYPGPVSIDGGGLATSACTQDAKLEYIFDAEVIEEKTITLVPALTKSLRGFFGADFYLDTIRYGHGFRPASWFGGETSYRFLVTFPQVGDWGAESIYEQQYLDHPTATNRESNSIFQSYPNQLTDAISKMYWGYITGGGSTLHFGVDWANSSAQLGAFNSSNMNDTIIGTKLAMLGLTTALAQGLAIRQFEPLHFALQAKDAFTSQFYDVMQRLKEINAGASEVGLEPTHWASLFIRAELDDSFTETDLMPLVIDAVTEDGETPDEDTFHIDPLRVV